MVMLVGTLNAPADSQGFIHNTIGEALGDVSTAEADDTIKYRNSDEEHIEYV